MSPPCRAAALLLGAAFLLLGPARAAAAVLSGAVVVRAEGRAPVRDGRVDNAHEQALDEAFRRGLLEALRVIAPERQSPHDLELWQETVLARAADFVGAWRILSEEQQGGFVTLAAELEVYRDKLARAARVAVPSPPAAAVRVLVLAGSLAPADGAGPDAARTAALSLEAELARRGAVIVTATDRAPWENATGPSSEENRVALAAAAGKKHDAEAVLIVELVRHPGLLVLEAQLIATASESTLASARADIPLRGDRPVPEAFAAAARQVAAACAPRLNAARSASGRGALPRLR